MRVKPDPSTKSSHRTGVLGGARKPAWWRFKALLAWRQEQVGASNGSILAYQLSCEGLPYEKIPPHLYEQIVAFRHLRHDVRVKLCGDFIWWFMKEPRGRKGCGQAGHLNRRPGGHKRWTYPCPYCLGHWT